MESSNTLPRLLKRTGYRDPMPAKEEFRVSFRCFSTSLAGLDLKMENRNNNEIGVEIDRSDN